MPSLTCLWFYSMTFKNCVTDKLITCILLNSLDCREPSTTLKWNIYVEQLQFIRTAHTSCHLLFSWEYWSDTRELNNIWFWRYLTRGLISHLSQPSIRPSIYYIWLWYHARIRSWNQPVLSNMYFWYFPAPCTLTIRFWFYQIPSLVYINDPVLILPNSQPRVH